MSNFADEQARSDWHAERPEADLGEAVDLLYSDPDSMREWMKTDTMDPNPPF